VTTPEKLFAKLEEMGIETSTVTHPPVFTVEEAKAHRGSQGGAHIKNLFLRNKKGEMWLVVAGEDLKLDLKQLGQQIGAGKVSFGSPERLMTYLGVIPGAVTPFSVLNDIEGKVRVVIDRAVVDASSVNAHPLSNEQTTTIGTDDLLRFMRECGHEIEVMDLAGDVQKS